MFGYRLRLSYLYVHVDCSDCFLKNFTRKRGKSVFVKHSTHLRSLWCQCRAKYRRGLGRLCVVFFVWCPPLPIDLVLERCPGEPVAVRRRLVTGVAGWASREASTNAAEKPFQLIVSSVLNRTSSWRPVDITSGGIFNIYTQNSLWYSQIVFACVSTIIINDLSWRSVSTMSMYLKIQRHECPQIPVPPYFLDIYDLIMICPRNVA